MRRSLGPSLVFLAALLGLTGCGSPKGTWLTTMKLALPGTVCSTDLFSECFAWADDDQCRELIKPPMESCIEEIEPELPAFIGPLRGKEWGEKIGACTGSRLEAAEIERVQFTPACRRAVEDMGHPMETFEAEVAAIRADQGLPPL